MSTLHYYLTELLLDNFNPERRILNLSSKSSIFAGNDISAETDWDNFLNCSKRIINSDTVIRLQNWLRDVHFRSPEVLAKKGLKFKSVSIPHEVVNSNSVTRTHFQIALFREASNPDQAALIKTPFAGNQSALHCLHTPFDSLMAVHCCADCHQPPLV